MSALATLRVRAATPADALAIRNLLERNRLPTSDLATSRPAFVVASDGGRIIGTGAIELFGGAALVRSVAVEAQSRGLGVGGLLVLELEQHARNAGVNELVLLTETAADFFAHRGYRIIDRNTAPRAIQETAEFRSLCPASAVCMAKNSR